MNANSCETRFEPLLKPKEAAELLRVNQVTLLRLVRKGQFPAVQIGKLWRFRISDLNAWINSEVAPKTVRPR